MASTRAVVAVGTAVVVQAVAEWVVVAVATTGTIGTTADRGHRPVRWVVEGEADLVAVAAAAVDRIAKVTGTVASVTTRTLPGAMNATAARHRKVMGRAVGRTVAVGAVTVAIGMVAERVVAVVATVARSAVGAVAAMGATVEAAVADGTTVVVATVVEQCVETTGTTETINDNARTKGAGCS